MTREEMFAIVRDCVADSLAREPSAIRAESLLVPELGADSLDFLDILFMLEKRFGVKLRENELDFLSRLDVSTAKAGKEGALTREAVERLQEWLPALRAVPDASKVTPGQLFSLISVETLCILVERKMPASAPGAADGR